MARIPVYRLEFKADDEKTSITLTNENGAPMFDAHEVSTSDLIKGLLAGSYMCHFEMETEGLGEEIQGAVICDCPEGTPLVGITHQAGRDGRIVWHEPKGLAKS